MRPRGRARPPSPGKPRRGPAGLWLVSCLIQEATFQLGRREDFSESMAEEATWGMSASWAPAPEAPAAVVLGQGQLCVHDRDSGLCGQSEDTPVSPPENSLEKEREHSNPGLP